ncbi:DinB family protein [Arenibacter sp. S6351L]|uniref:DinB family protein n=1 Tax=Arenibacter sp. S6351L TaxID=2926407 RepID=UPI001FF6D78A|nr:DinB family protein [Arenibacter sp. S6351L]MCK0133547.1 DinB family protein [Arenibacter sp. S6351L]
MHTTLNKTPQVISSQELLDHWQGHRALTRRTIEVFPEEAFFSHTIGGMRTFVEMVMELLAIAGPGLKEIATGKSAPFNEHLEHGNKKDRLLELWDKATAEINTYWAQIKEEQFQQNIKIFGQYDCTVRSSIFYFIDNEIHHRGQAYVYLRTLGIEPPAFYER